MEPFAWNVGKFHQKVELRKASGLDSWKDVPTPTFQLDLGPCHFTNGFGLMGAEDIEEGIRVDIVHC